MESSRSRLQKHIQTFSIKTNRRSCQLRIEFLSPCILPLSSAGSAKDESSVNAAAVVIPIILIVLLVVGGVVAYHFRKRIRKRYPNFLVCGGRRNSALTNEQAVPLNTDTRTNDSEAVYLDPKGGKALFIKSQDNPEDRAKAHPTTSTPDTNLPTTVSVISEQKGEEENNKTRSSAEHRPEEPVKDSDNNKEICQLASGTQVGTEEGTVPAGLDKETTENNHDAPDRTQEADVVSGHTQENALCSEGNAVAGATDDTLRDNAQSVDDADTGRDETVTRNNEHRAGRTPVPVTSPNQGEVTTADFDLLGNKSPEAEARLEWNEVGDTGDTQIGVKSTSSDQGRDVDVDQARSQSAEAEENSQPADGKADTDTPDSTDDTVDAAPTQPSSDTPLLSSDAADSQETDVVDNGGESSQSEYDEQETSGWFVSYWPFKYGIKN
ncbi:hypothetical protein BaRGS_00031924 [Batillaria attramentaria]|uniref:Uncharacterized protein n=1 Tax=Batillaria attramentaria TaxID=370345 RepID=A0ABD0JPR0_9CAEN